MISFQKYIKTLLNFYLTFLLKIILCSLNKQVEAINKEKNTLAQKNQQLGNKYGLALKELQCEREMSKNLRQSQVRLFYFIYLQSFLNLNK